MLDRVITSDVVFWLKLRVSKKAPASSVLERWQDTSVMLI